MDNVVAVPILNVSVDGVPVDPAGSVALAPNELLASAGAGSYELTVVPKSSSAAGPG